MDTWFRIKQSLTSTGDFSFAGSGHIHYHTGFDISVDTAVAVINASFKMTKFEFDLGMEQGRYHVPLAFAKGVNPQGDSTWMPDEIILQGPILSGETTVGYFEIMGDDHVVVLDKDRKIVATH